MFRIRREQMDELAKSGGVRHQIISNLRDSFLSVEPDEETRDILVTDAKGQTARLGFDDRGNVAAFTTPLCRQYRFENNAEGQRTASTNPTGMRLEMDYNDQGQMIGISVGEHARYTLEYDSLNNLTKIIYPDGTCTQMTYAGPNRLTSFTNRLGQTEIYERDDIGDLFSITEPEGNRTTFDYGEWNRPDRATYADGSFETYEYNPAGLVQRLSVNGELWAECSYDDSENITEIRYADGHTVVFTYNEAGQVTEARNEDITVKYEYDEQNRLIAENQGGQVVRYSYDELGQLVGLTLPSSETLGFSFDADGQIAQIKDWKGQIYHFRYDNGGQLVEQQLPNGLITRMRYSEVGLPVEISSRSTNRWSDAPVFSQRYQYDLDDRVTVLQDTDFGRREYRYDAEGQVLGVASSLGMVNEVFAYDANGNRIQANSETAEFNQLNQLTWQSRTTYQYDARGNLFLESGPKGTTRYFYNGQNLLIAVETSDGKRVEFAYDAFARRIRKSSGDVVVRYLWAGDQLIGELTEGGRGSERRDYLLLPGTHIPLATRVNDEIYYYHNDYLGTPQRLTDNSGRVVWSAEYSAYGSAQIEREIIKNHLRLPGQYYDEETKLHYNRYRYYSPSLGRYLSRDALTYLVGLNFYTYAGNNPINVTDPMGMWSWKSIGKALLVGAAAIAVGAAIVVAAPVVLGAIGITGAIAAGITVVAAGAAAGAAAAGVSAAMDGASILCAMKKGALIGAAAALPFAFLPATAGVVAFAGAGALSGAIGYTANHLLTPGAQWNWGDFAKTVGIAAATAGLGRWLLPKISARLKLGGAKERDAVTRRLQRHVTRAAREVDALGDRAFTPRQLRAIRRNPNLRPMYRGNRIDVKARQFIKNDHYFQHLESNYRRGPDFRNPRTGAWWDMTTEASWPSHVNKYGPNGIRLDTSGR